MKVRSATPADLERLLLLLDQAFIFGKKRMISLHRRFPAVYCRDNLDNLLLCHDGEEIISALAMRRFGWKDQGECLRGAMIGAVYTRPERRGQGWASRLLETARERLRDDNVDFGVLWTTQPDFYARLGWKAADRSMLGEMAIEIPDMTVSGNVKRLPAENAAVPIEAIRRYRLDVATLRDLPDDYRQLPPPAEKVEALLHGQGTENAAYALVGRCGDTAILYEMAGNPDCFPALWQEAQRECRHILVNEQEGSPTQRWLAGNAALSWQAKQLAMWLPLSRKMAMARAAQWVIPYFDRI